MIRKFSFFIFVVLIVAFIVSGCTRTTTLDSVQRQESDIADTNVSQTEKVPNPVSLPALMKKQFSGTDFTIGKVLADMGAYTRYYITYKSGALKISGIMNVPKGKGPFPLLILNHGHIDTTVYINGRGLKREQDYLARYGYVVVHPDYRNHADSDKDPDAETSLRLGYTEDSINAVLAVQSAKLSYVDGENVGMLGHSMGGGVTQNVLVVKPGLIKAAALFAPVSSDYRDNFKKWTSRSTPIADKIVELYGTPTSSPEFWDNISSKTFFNSIVAPIMIHHGTTDESVPLEWSERSVTALRAAGKDVTFFTYPGEPHEFINAWPQVMRRTVDFFDTYLKTSSGV